MESHNKHGASSAISIGDCVIFFFFSNGFKLTVKITFALEHRSTQRGECKSERECERDREKPSFNYLNNALSEFGSIWTAIIEEFNFICETERKLNEEKKNATINVRL